MELQLSILVLFTLLYFQQARLEQHSKGLDSYTTQELDLLPKFHDRVKDGLTLKYMHQNKYLVRFLRASSWNVDEAVRMIRENFHWRNRNSMDNLILQFHNSSKYHQKFPFFFTSALDQRPTLVGALLGINVRQMALSGELAKVKAYIYYSIERAVWNIHLTSNRTGMEIIGGNLLFNMAGFNLRTQGCVACIPLWIELVESYENYYPQLGHRIIIVNSPRIFQSIFVIMKPLASSHSLKALSLYSLDRSEWEEELLKLFPKDKLTVEFGGTAPPQQLYKLTPDLLEIQLGPQVSEKYALTFSNKIQN